MYLTEDCEIAVYSSEPRCLVVNTALMGVKSTRATQGVGLMTLKKNKTLDYACTLEASGVTNLARYRGRSIPATGALLREEDSEEKQITIL